MNRNSCAKRLLSLLLCLTLILGLLPNVALAADADGVRYQENADVAVTYDDVDRTHATVRYHKPGAQVDSYNIIFLVDTSVQGKDSFESFEKMMVESGSDTIFDSTSNNLVSLINYTTTAETNRVNNDGIYALMSQVIHGAGTANEITALDAALAEVKSLKNSERSSYPTIVFWVLGKELVEVGNAAFESIYFGLPMSHRASCLRICFENNPAFYIFLFRQKKRSNGGWLLRQILHNTRRLYRDEAPLK